MTEKEGPLIPEQGASGSRRGSSSPESPDEDRDAPPITAELRERARKNPSSWLYAVDPAYDPEGEVPPEGIMGAWWVDEQGEISGPFERNPNYSSSDEVSADSRLPDLPDPTDPIDAAVQQAAIGRGADADVLSALLDGDLLLYAGDEPGFLSVPSDDGAPVVHVFTSQAHAKRASWDRWQRMSGRELASVFPDGHDLHVNPGAVVAVRIPGDAFRTADSEPEEQGPNGTEKGFEQESS